MQPNDMKGDWQPIDTAPRDGRRFLTYYNHNGADYIEITRWVKYETTKEIQLTDDLYRKERVVEFDGVCAPPERFTLGLGFVPSRATHWMPLPEAPSLATELLREGV